MPARSAAKTIPLMPSATDRIVDHFDSHDPGGVVGVYLYGSSIAGGLRQESDIDLLLVSRRSLSTPERRVMTDLLLRYSGRTGNGRARPARSS